MSLTSFLDSPNVKQKFNEEFPKPSFAIKKELLAPPLTTRYSMVGTAFDYLLRFLLKYQNPQSVSKEWIAESALLLISDTSNLYKKATDILSDAKVHYSNYLKTGNMTDALLKSALSLAQLDPLARAGVIDENLGSVDDKDKDDLRKLISLVNGEDFKVKKVCLLDPTFGKASRLVGGADVDLVIDNTMIDIKTTKKLELKREHYNQLVGYYTLYRIGGIDSLPPKQEICTLAIYFSRYGYLHKMDVNEIIDKKRFSTFLKWFEARASDHLPSMTSS